MTIPKTHGYYVASNSCNYGVHLSDCGEQAKLIMNDEDCTVTDWLDIEWIVSDDDDGEFEPFIDPEGYNVPLNYVVATN
jgi:hypothetical protein